MATSSTTEANNVNAILPLIGRHVFEYEVSKFLQPYERFALAATCRFMSVIFNFCNDDIFNVHSKADLPMLKRDIIDKYLKKRKMYRYTNCIDLSNKAYSRLTRHERLSMKYVLIFQEKLPYLFPVHSFQNFLDYALKLTLSSNDADYADSIIQFLHDIVVHEKSNIQYLIQNVHLDNTGLNSWNHLKVLSNDILCCTTNLRYLYLADNPLINDDYVQDLFLCIAANNHHLEIVDLSNTSVGNKTCYVIYDFCQSVYKINNGRYSNYNSDNDSNYQSSPNASHSHHIQEVIYMSSDDDEQIEESDADFSTDDEFDNITESRAVAEEATSNADGNDDDNEQMNVEQENEEEEEANADAVMESAHESDANNEEEKADVVVEEEASTRSEMEEEEEEEEQELMLPDTFKITLNLKCIDLHNNKGITTKGVDRLNQIYVRRIEPNHHFIVNVEGCSYEINPSWDLKLL